jgi:hypothetical protein
MELSPSQGLSASLTLDFVASRESLDAAEAATKQLPAAALYYGAVCPVFPCEPRGKRPLGALAPHGVKDATRDPDLIRRWWATCPTANIGLACGVTCCALDVDGLEGWHALTGLTARHGALPATVTSCTGAGGWHLFFAMPAGRTVRNSAGKLGPKLDVRGVGGYVVAPPSVHPSGRPYAFAAGLEPWSAPLASAPPWLLDLLDPPPPPAPCASAPPRFWAIGSGGADAYARAALEGELTRLADAPEGQRNDTLVRSAFSLGQLVGTGRLAGAAVVAALAGVAGQIGLDRREVERTIVSGLEAGMASPRGIGHA